MPLIKIFCHPRWTRSKACEHHLSCLACLRTWTQCTWGLVLRHWDIHKCHQRAWHWHWHCHWHWHQGYYKIFCSSFDPISPVSFQCLTRFTILMLQSFSSHQQHKSQTAAVTGNIRVRNLWQEFTVRIDPEPGASSRIRILLGTKWHRSIYSWNQAG